MKRAEIIKNGNLTLNTLSKKRDGVVRIIWSCNYCKDICVSYSNERHRMDVCDCGKSGIDLEEEYSRVFGDIKEINKKVYIDGSWEKVS